MRENVIGAENQQGRLNEKLTADYIIGVVDGEGYFSVSANMERCQGYLIHRTRLVFGIKLNVVDGKILYNIKDWFGCGTIQYRSDDRENFSDCLEFQVRDMQSIREIIVPFFTKHSLKFPKKKIAFERFREIAEMTKQGVHRTKDGFAKIRNLAQTLHS